MVLKFTRTEQDFRAPADHFWSTSKTIRRMLRRNYLAGAVMAVLTASMVISEMRGNDHETSPLTFPLVILGALVTLLALSSPLWQKVRYRRMALRVYRESSHVDPYGPVTVELTDEGIWAGNKNQDTSVRWRGVERIDTSPDYTFVYLGVTSALIIPRVSVTEGDYEAFVAALTERWERYKAETSARAQSQQ